MDILQAGDSNEGHCNLRSAGQSPNPEGAALDANRLRYGYGRTMETTDTKRTFRLILYDALASEAMGALTAGVFLTGPLVELGASNLAIGLLAAVPFTVQFLQLPAVVLVERLRVRRTIATWAAGIGRSFLIAAATAPFL